MSTFIPLGSSGVLSYADDSTDAAVTCIGATAIQVVNPDTANVVVFNVSFNALDHNAVVPTSELNGTGTVIGPNSTVTLSIPQAQYGQTMYVSAAGVSGTGNVYFSLGAL